jgi:hypothetical protein
VEYLIIPILAKAFRHTEELPFMGFLDKQRGLFTSRVPFEEVF